MRVESYPLSGTGTIEVMEDKLRVEGSRGLPWEVHVLGTLGFLVGCLAMYAIVTIRGNTRSSAVAGGGALVAALVAGSAAGYALSRRRARPQHTIEFLFASIVDVAGSGELVEVTVTFRKHWQKRKQVLHFRPTNADDVAPLAEAIRLARTTR